MNWTTPVNLTRNTSLRRWIIWTSGLGMMFLLYLFLSSWVGFTFSLIDNLQCKGPCTLSPKFSYASFRFIRISHPFLSKCLWMRKRIKSNMVRIFLLWMKVSEAVCKDLKCGHFQVSAVWYWSSLPGSIAAVSQRWQHSALRDHRVSGGRWNPKPTQQSESCVCEIFIWPAVISPYQWLCY